MLFFNAVFVGLLGLSVATIKKNPPIEVPYHENDFPVEPLPKLNIVLNETTVSGYSAGSFFASHFHVAHSSFIQGAGMVSGGPYGCINEHPIVLPCLGLTTDINPIRDGKIYNKMVKLAADGKIDPLENIKNQRLFAYSGLNDTMVANPSSKASARLYARIADPSKFVFEEIVAEHNYPNDFDAPQGNSAYAPCAKRVWPFISNCHYDVTGKILTHIFGQINPRNPPENPRLGRFMKFDQNELLSGLQNVETKSLYKIGLGPHGFLYIPNECDTENGFNADNKCKLHVVFHGCEQQLSGEYGMYFMTNTAYINYADTNKLILAFPQTVKNTVAPNFSSLFVLFHPGASMACWDFFGMYDAEYHTKNGRQIQAVRNLIDKIVP